MRLMPLTIAASVVLLAGAVGVVGAWEYSRLAQLRPGDLRVLVALAVLMPIVAGMGGNAATQTLTVIVRGIALGELSFTNARKTLIKEALVGLGNGLALSTVSPLADAAGALLVNPEVRRAYLGD